MKFKKMLKLMVKDPKLKFRSDISGSYEQDLSTIEYWLAEKSGIEQLIYWLDAKDWELEDEV